MRELEKEKWCVLWFFFPNQLLGLYHFPQARFVTLFLHILFKPSSFGTCDHFSESIFCKLVASCLCIWSLNFASNVTTSWLLFGYWDENLFKSFITKLDALYESWVSVFLCKFGMRLIRFTFVCSKLWV